FLHFDPADAPRRELQRLNMAVLMDFRTQSNQGCSDRRGCKGGLGARVARSVKRAEEAGAQAGTYFRQPASDKDLAIDTELPGDIDPISHGLHFLFVASDGEIARDHKPGIAFDLTVDVMPPFQAPYYQRHFPRIATLLADKSRVFARLFTSDPAFFK